jgi:ferric-dicitrate binding protein FerR (iron transport regulator)
MTHQPIDSDCSQDTDLAALLRASGTRAQPSGAALASVRAAVAEEWQATVAARKRRSSIGRWSVAAAVATAAVGLWITRPMYLAPAVQVASIERMEGTVSVQNRDQDGWHPASAAVPIHRGDRLRTGTGGRIAVKLPDGLGIRLDENTVLAFESGSRASLAQGAVYVDSGGSHGDSVASLEVATTAGTVRHLGTQYQARLSDVGLQVAVREGQVAIAIAGHDVVATAGEQLTVRDQQVHRDSIAANSNTWSWIGSVTPPFNIEGKSVDSFLTWAARETGRTVVYASPEAARRAHSVTLNGSIAGLSPDSSIDAVLSSTTLRPSRTDGQIRVDVTAP